MNCRFPSFVEANILEDVIDSMLDYWSGKKNEEVTELLNVLNGCISIL